MLNVDVQKVNKQKVPAEKICRDFLFANTDKLS